MDSTRKPVSAITFRIMAVHISDHRKLTSPLKNNITPISAGHKTNASSIG
jgi:hypothetical protein